MSFVQIALILLLLSILTFIIGLVLGLINIIRHKKVKYGRYTVFLALILFGSAVVFNAIDTDPENKSIFSAESYSESSDDEEDDDDSYYYDDTSDNETDTNSDDSDVDTTESDEEDDEFDPDTLKDLVKKQLDSDGIGDPVIKNVKINGQFLNEPYTASVELDALDPGDASDNYVFVNSALAATQKLDNLDSFESIKYIVSTEFENSATGEDQGYKPVTTYVFKKDFIKSVDPKTVSYEDLRANASDFFNRKVS